MSMLFSGPQGFQIAGKVPNQTGINYGAFGDALNALGASPLTPGFTGTATSNNVVSTEGVNANLRYLLDLTQQRDQQAYARELSNWDRVRQMRKEEAKEAYEMQLPFKVAGAVGNVFKGISDAVAPARAYELAIRAQTPGLIAQTYANNPFANRKWIS